MVTVISYQWYLCYHYQVDYVIREATSLDNLAVLYEGWTPWVWKLLAVESSQYACDSTGKVALNHVRWQWAMMSVAWQVTSQAVSCSRINRQWKAVSCFCEHACGMNEAAGLLQSAVAAGWSTSQVCLAQTEIFVYVCVYIAHVDSSDFWTWRNTHVLHTLYFYNFVNISCFSICLWRENKNVSRQWAWCEWAFVLHWPEINWLPCGVYSDGSPRTLEGEVWPSYRVESPEPILNKQPYLVAAEGNCGNYPGVRFPRRISGEIEVQLSRGNIHVELSVGMSSCLRECLKEKEHRHIDSFWPAICTASWAKKIVSQLIIFARCLRMPHLMLFSLWGPFGCAI